MSGPVPQHAVSGQSQMLFEHLFESSPDAVAVTDPLGRIVLVNKQLERAFGYTRDELIGQLVEILLPEGFRGSHLSHRKSHSEKPHVRAMAAGLELYGRRKDGSEFPVDIMLSPVDREHGSMVLAVIRDISRLNLALKAAQTGIWELDLVKDTAVRSLRHDEIFGYSELQPKWGVEIFLPHVVPEDRERATQSLERAKKTGEFDLECRIVRVNDHSVRWIASQGRVVRNEKREPVRMLGIVLDITERKQAEEALRRSDERFRLVVEGVKDHAIFMLDPSGRVESWNPGAERIKGYRAEEIVGQHSSRFFTQEDIERGRPDYELKMAAAHMRFEGEGWRVRKDGSRFWANTVITAVRDSAGNITGFSKITRDFTGRKKAEDLLLLELSNAMLRNLDIRKLLCAFSDSIQQIVPNDYASIALHDAKTQTLRVQRLDAFVGEGPAQVEIVLPVEGSAPGWVFTNRVPLLVNRLDTERFDPDGYAHLIAEGIQSGCWLPLISRERVLGIMLIASRKEAAFRQEDVDLLLRIAGQVATAMDNAIAFQQIADLSDKLKEEKRYLEEELRTEHSFDEIIGESLGLKRVLKLVETVAPTDATVLILGETGTGKELIARAIHNLSARREQTFIKLNCSAIPAGLLESELFGHEKGAFTGAIAQKIGRLELAHQGTLFLDEIGDLPLELQPKILRALQEQELERLGGTRTIPVNIRLIAATNRDLTKMVNEGQFRSDLYYRLRVFPITMPPLRERREDIPALVRYFVTVYAKRMKRPIETVPAGIMQALTKWRWPGNVRELENFIERSVILTQGSLLRAPLAELEVAEEPLESSGSNLETAEREHILRVLREAGGKIGGLGGAAERLGLKRTTLNSMIKKLGIKRTDYI